MPRIRTIIAAILALIPLGLAAGPAHAEKRIALVIGNAGYQTGALNTPANDAGLIAQTLQAAGFDVAGARDLDQDSLRHAFRDFVEKATSSGPDTVAFVYVSGYGLQLEGENYFVPIDARIPSDVDIASEAVRLSDYSRPLAALKLKAGIIVVDGARANPFAKSGHPIAGGLALVDPDPGLLIAFNAAPGTVAPEGQGPYGPYAQALAEMIREGGLPLDGVFERARLRVNDMTAGAEVPWDASKVEQQIVFFERAADAPPPAVAPEQTAAIRARPIRDLGPPDAYTLALERDTIDGYVEFVDAYPDAPMAPRVRAIIAARREAITWRRTRAIDSPPAYWTYLRRYPEGPHCWDARRRLAFLREAYEPPPRFALVDYDVPPPPPDEIVYIRRPVLVFDDPEFGFAPPPPAPIVFLAPPPPEFIVLAPPPPPIGIFILPIPVYRPVPVWVQPPAYVAPPPPNNVIYNNIHNTVVVNNVTNTVTVTNQAGQTRTIQPPAQAAAPGQAGAGGAQAPAAAIGPSLPPSVAHKAALQSSTSPGGAPGTPPSAPANKPATGAPLPGMQGQPLPPAGTPAPGATKPAGTPPTTATAPSAAVTPGSTPAKSPATGAKPTIGSPTVPPGAPAKPGTATAPAAKLTPPTSPSATPPGGTAPPASPGTKLSVPSTPPVVPHSATGSPPGSPTSPTAHPPSPAAKATPSSPAPAPHVTAPQKAVTPAAPPKPPAPHPSASIAPPPPAAVRPPPPPPAAVKPPPPPPAAPPPPRVVMPAPPPPPKPPAPAAAPPPAPAVARPAPAPAAAPKGCPPGKTPAVVNGQPTCK
jgi:uncharacterized caspase-like protein